MEIRVLRRWETVTYPKPGKPLIMLALVYQADMWPPRTVMIPKDLATDETIKAAIKADIEANPPTPPRTFIL